MTDFLERANDLAKAGKTASCLDIVYMEVEKLLWAGDWNEINNLITQSKSLHLDVQLGLLVQSSHAPPGSCPDRAALYEKVFKEHGEETVVGLREQRGSPHPPSIQNLSYGFGQAIDEISNSP